MACPNTGAQCAAYGTMRRAEGERGRAEPAATVGSQTHMIAAGQGGGTSRRLQCRDREGAGSRSLVAASITGQSASKGTHRRSLTLAVPKAEANTTAL